MRRWLAILLLVFLPFQLSWAAVAGYCQHEVDAAAPHFGHHQHQHQADADPEGAPDSQLAGGIDNDCGACHAGCCAALIGMPSLSWVASGGFAIARPVAPPASPPQSQPERPNWSGLA